MPWPPVGPSPGGAAGGDLSGSYPNPTVATVGGRQVGVVLGQSGAAVSHTGDTNETALATVAIPAGLLGANGLIVVDMLFAHTGTAGSVACRVRFGASGAGLGGTQVANVSLSSGNSSGRGMMTLVNANSTSSQIGQTTGQLFSPYTQSSAAGQVAAIPTANASELVVSGQLGNGADTMTLSWYQVIAYPHS